MIKHKQSVSSIDVKVLAAELNELLKDARVDKAYQLPHRGFKIKVGIRGSGSKELVVYPHFFCVSRFSRPAPERPTGLAMQLRKHLKGSFIRSVRQVGFDRIVELGFGKSEDLKYLVCEFFHHGNVFLLDSDRKILGLLEWQKWKDRVLGVGKTYEPPTAHNNPFEFSKDQMTEILSASEDTVVKTIISSIGLPGIWAEEACINAGLEKTIVGSKATSDQIRNLTSSITSLLSDIGESHGSGILALDEAGDMADVTSIPMKVFEGLECRKFNSLNEAIDEYFSGLEEETAEVQIDDKIGVERKRLETILDKQRQLVLDAELESEQNQKAGDLIYQHMAEIGEIASAIESARKKGLSDSQILEKFRQGACDGLHSASIVKGLKKEKLLLDL